MDYEQIVIVGEKNTGKDFSESSSFEDFYDNISNIQVRTQLVHHLPNAFIEYKSMGAGLYNLIKNDKPKAVIIPYSNREEHVVKNINLFCPEYIENKAKNIIKFYELNPIKETLKQAYHEFSEARMNKTSFVGSKSPVEYITAIYPLFREKLSQTFNNTDYTINVA